MCYYSYQRKNAHRFSFIEAFEAGAVYDYAESGYDVDELGLGVRTGTIFLAKLLLWPLGLSMHWGLFATHAY